MSTRSRIGILNEDHTVTSIYCHFDGYPTGVGKILFDHYQDEKKIRDLMNLGDLSSLGSEIGEDQGTDWFDNRFNILHPDQNLDTDDPRRNWCVAYKRDRGEEGTDAQTHLYTEWPDCWAEYEYLFSRGEWSMKDRHFNRLSDVLDKESQLAL